MATRADTLSTHPVWAQLSAVSTALDAAAESKATPETAKPELARVRKAVARIGLLLEIVDPDLVNFNELAEMSNHLTNVSSWVNTCATGSDVSPSISTVSDLAPGWTSRLASATPIPGATAKTLTSAATLRRESEAAAAEMDLRLKALTAEIEAVRADTADVCSSVTSAGADLAVIRSESTQAAAQFRTQAEAEKAEALASLRAEAAALVASMQESETERIASFESSTQEVIDEGEAILNRLRDLAAQVDATAKAVGDHVLSGDYGIHAGAERDAANRLRLGAILALVGAVGFAVWAAVSASTGQITWQRLAAKALATLVFSGLGGYLATQSREHRDEERKARRRHLDLRALGPFIVDLAVEEQQSIRGELARNAFLSQAVDSSAERVPRRGISTDQLKTVVEIISAARK